MATTAPTITCAQIQGRIARLRERLDPLGLDALLVTAPANVRYLSGFTGSAGMLLITPEAQWLATDSRYYTQVAMQCPDYTLVKAGYGYFQGLVEQWNPEGQRLGIEKEHVTLAVHEKLTETAPQATFLPTSDVVRQLRAIKDAWEVALMRRSIALGDEALAQVLPFCKPGVTENQIITKLLGIMRAIGADGPSYDPIVASGPNSAIVHHRGSDRALEPGDVLLFDTGVICEGYCSDMTRVFFVEREDPEMKAIYDIVLESHLLGYDVTGPGASAKEVDLKTRQVITDAGYGDFYGHSLGHGIGLEVHELPRVSRLSEDTIETGMFHTIEPGIYIPGKGGIRVEDICLITDAGPERITGHPKEMRVLQY